MEFKLCLTIAAVLLFGVATVYTQKPLTIRSVLRRKESLNFFVVASQGNLSNGQLSARCDGRHSRNPQARFAQLRIGEHRDLRCIQFINQTTNEKYALKAIGEPGTNHGRVVFERQDCHRNVGEHFKFKQIEITNTGSVAWESIGLRGWYLHCPTDNQARLTLIAVKNPQNAPRIQFHTRYIRRSS